MDSKDLGKTTSGMDANVAGLLCYVAGWLTGLIFFLIEKENKFVRFHAMQSIIVFGALFAVHLVLGVLISLFAAVHLGALIPLLALVSKLLMLVGLILWVLLMIKAYQGQLFKLPVAGDLAAKQIQDNTGNAA